MHIAFVHALPLTQRRLNSSLSSRCTVRHVGIRRPPSRVATVTMAKDDSGGTALGLRLVAGVLALGLVGTALAPIVSGIRTVRNNEPVPTVSTTLNSTTVGQKLRRVPVFAVTDETGRPYMSETEDHKSRTGYFFVDPSDAELFLSRVRETVEEGEKELARVRTVTLEEAIPFIGRKRSNGFKGVPERFQLVPDEKQTKIANDITGGKFEKTFKDGVPLFYVENLALRGKEESEVFIPVFFEKQTLDEYMKKAKDAGGISETPIQVIDLLQTIRELRAGQNERLRQVELYPLEKAISYMAKSKALEAAGIE